MKNGRTILVCGCVIVLMATIITLWAADIAATLDSTDGSSAFRVSDRDTNTILEVQSDGRVGIGTNSPDATLDIHSGRWNLDATEGDLRIGNGTYRLKVGVATAGGGSGIVRLRAQGGANSLRLGAGTKDVLFVRPTGVGIGTNTPGHALDVNGNVQISDLASGESLTNVVVADDQGVLYIRNANALPGGGLSLPYLETANVADDTAFSILNASPGPSGGNGILGHSRGAGAQQGVLGRADSDNSSAVGVRGLASTDFQDGSAYGVMGLASGTNGSLRCGVYGVDEATLQYGYIGGSAYALYAYGDVAFEHGDVGVGTKEPSEELEVRGTAPSLRVAGDDGQTASLQLYEVTNGTPYGFEFEYKGSADKLHLWSRTFQDNEARRMTWDKYGNVGIGAPAPTRTLDVDGQVRVRDLPSSNSLDSVVVADSQGVLHVRDAASLGGGGSGFLPYSAGASTVGAAFAVTNRFSGVPVIGLYGEAVDPTGIGTMEHYGVYGKAKTESDCCGKAYGVFGCVDKGSGGSTICAVYGSNDWDNTSGYLGGTAGARGTKRQLDGSIVTYGTLGDSTYGAYGKHQNSGNYGGLGGSSYAVFGNGPVMFEGGDVDFLFSNGRLGIGETADSQPLQVAGDVRIGEGAGADGDSEVLTVRGQSGNWNMGVKNARNDFFIGTGASDFSTFRIEENGDVWIGTDRTGTPDAKLVVKNDGVGASFRVEDSSASPDTTPFLINSNGYVGVRKANPQAPLDVNGTTRTEVLEITGAKGADLAEHFSVHSRDSSAQPEPGMLVCIDGSRPGDLVVSQQAYDRCVAGVISGAGNLHHGMLLGRRPESDQSANPVALSGRVYCWADASETPIQPGDMLTTSSTPGHAMKATDRQQSYGAVIGKAMSPLEEGKGLVLVLVGLQ